MIEIKDLLSRFDHLLTSSNLKIDSIRETIGAVLGISINKKDIEIKNGTVYLNIKPIYKNEILIKKEKIEELLEKSLGSKAPKDFR